HLFRSEPTEVMAISVNSGAARVREIDESTGALLRFDSGRVAAFVTSFNAADAGSYHIVGTKGQVSVEPGYYYAEGLGYELTVGNKTTRKRIGKRDQFAPELLYFSDCVLRNREPEPSGEEGLQDVRIVEALYESAKKGRAVRLPAYRPSKRPTGRQRIRRPGIRKPALVNVESSNEDWLRLGRRRGVLRRRGRVIGVVTVSARRQEQHHHLVGGVRRRDDGHRRQAAIARPHGDVPSGRGPAGGRLLELQQELLPFAVDEQQERLADQMRRRQVQRPAGGAVRAKDRRLPVHDEERRRRSFDQEFRLLLGERREVLRLHAAIRCLLQFRESLLELADHHLHIVEDASHRAPINLRGPAGSLLQIVEAQQRCADVPPDAFTGFSVVDAVMVLHMVSSPSRHPRGAGGWVVRARISRTSASKGTGLRNTRSAPAARARSHVDCVASAVAMMIGTALVTLLRRRLSQTAYPSSTGRRVSVITTARGGRRA